MLTVPHVVEHLSTPWQPPRYLPHNAMTSLCYCMYCGEMLQHPPERSIATTPRVCVIIRSSTLDRHARVCEECAQIVTGLWYYQGRGGLTLKDQELVSGIEHEGQNLLTPVQLDVYIWILRHGFPGRFTGTPVRSVAPMLGYAYSTIRTALMNLCRAGLLERQRNGRINWYRALIHQLPKGE